MSEPDTTELLARARAGDGDALADLYRAHAHQVRAFVAARVPDADGVQDVAAEVWLRIVRAIGRHRGEAWARWWWTIARHAIHDHDRRAARVILVAGIDTVDPDADPADTVLTACDRAARSRWLHEVGIAALPEQARAVLALHLAECDLDEIVEETGRSRGAITATLYRTRRDLAELARNTGVGWAP